jgi:hypothetical protein
MRTKEEMLAYLEANRIRKAPKPKAPTAAELAVERFAEDRKPTERVILDAAAHNKAVLKRMREQREAELRTDRNQALMDRCWERTIEAQAAQEAFGRSLCHRGPGDPDW